MFTFYKTSLAGTGMVGVFVSLLFKWLGIDIDEGQITEIANSLVFTFFFVIWVVGQVMRKDLTWGIFRKKPLQ